MDKQVPLPAFAAADPRWLAHRYDVTSDAVRFRFVDRTMHAGIPFLTDEYLGPTLAEAPLLARGKAVAQAASAPLHLLFHSAFCNSTLLCRAFDVAGIAMGLSEPVILNDIVGIRRRREGDPAKLPEITADAMSLLARPWGFGEAVVVKPSNILNPLAAGMLSLRPDAQALLLYAPLDLFLNSVARKGMWCRLWVRELLEGLLKDGVVDLGFSPTDYFRLTDLQVAAVGWLAQHKLFHNLCGRFGGARIRTLDSEVFGARQAEVIAALADHFGLAIDEGRAHAIAAGPVFGRHSKHGTGFSIEARRAEQAATDAAHGEEIAKVSEWARVVAAQSGIAEVLPLPLLG
jgi:hypothetical protein